jgi:hypothetical protein
MPLCRLGPPAWSFAVDAHSCIMVLPLRGATEYKVARGDRAKAGSSSDRHLNCNGPTGGSVSDKTEQSG